MRTLRVAAIVVFLLGFSGATLAQQHSENHFQQLNFLVGDWQAEGGGNPGQGSGAFSFHTDLQGQILIRKNKAHYPAAANRAAYDHADMMVIYASAAGPLKAVYFDSEGHVIQYTISTTPDESSATFVSEASPSAPRFRLTYAKLGGDRITGQFEIAPVGKPETFSPYLKWTARRMPPH